MLYELIAVARPGNLTHVKEIATNTARTILSSRGTIRSITNWGQFDLPRPTTKHQSQHFQGHYFIIQFDSSIAAQNELKRNLGLDPRMIRFSVVKLGDKLGNRRPGGIESVGSGGLVWKEEDARTRSFGALEGALGNISRRNAAAGR